MMKISDNACCASCRHWTMGPEWCSSPRGIICKGICNAKKNPRKRWNYKSVRDCTLFEPRPNRSVIACGDTVPTQEEMGVLMDRIGEIVDEVICRDS